MKVKFNQSYFELQKNIKKLPKAIYPFLFARTKRDAENMVKNFQEGIRQNSFRLEKLKDGTIKRKRDLGYSHPKTPLYGKGDEQKKNSLINSLRVKKIKNGHKVYVSIAKHWSGKIKLDDLMTVHNGGTIIKSKSGSLIRIPARPAFFKAYQRTLIKKRESEFKDNQTMRLLINQYIKDGKKSQIKKETERTIEGLKKFETEGE